MQSDLVLLPSMPASLLPVSLYSTMQAPAPSAKIILSRSCSSTTLDRVSAPITRQVLACPDFEKTSACINHCSQPGQPNKISYGTQKGLFMPSACFTRDAIEGTASD